LKLSRTVVRYASTDAQWDIIGPGDTAQGQTWGNQEEAELICELLNFAYACGRASYAQQVLDELKAEEKEDAEAKTEAAPPEPTSPTAKEDDGIPF
jgi:hypothetical protein